jgi:hypothetical protein
MYWSYQRWFRSYCIIFFWGIVLEVVIIIIWFISVFIGYFGVLHLYLLWLYNPSTMIFIDHQYQIFDSFHNFLDSICKFLYCYYMYFFNLSYTIFNRSLNSRDTGIDSLIDNLLVMLIDFVLIEKTTHETEVIRFLLWCGFDIGCKVERWLID